MDDKTILDELLARLKDRAEYAHFASGDPDTESYAVPMFVIEEIIADLTKSA